MTDACTVDGCTSDGRVIAKTYCSMHWQRWKKTGDAGVPHALRSPKGSGHRNTEGYREIWDPAHPNARKNGTIFEHVHVMSEHLGRPLMNQENVHHLNGVRDDNRIENLELWTTWQPAGQRVADKLAWAKQFIAAYETPAAAQDRTEDGELKHIVVDFDGTLAENLWTVDNPTTEIGQTMWQNVAKLKAALDDGYTADIHTARGWHDSDAIYEWLEAHNLRIRAVVCGKPLGLFYVDDKALHESAEKWTR